MDDAHIDNPDDLLSADELKVINLWRDGYNMMDAYCTVLKVNKAEVMPEALRKRVTRFFGNERMRSAMAFNMGKQEKAQAQRDEANKKKREKKRGKLVADMNRAGKDVLEQAKENEYINETLDRISPGQEAYNIKNVESARERWEKSLNISDTPSILSITGSAQLILATAMGEMLARSRAIRQNGEDVLDPTGRGSALTKNIISAFKAVADVIMVYAPPPTLSERREMSKASQILCSVIDHIKESPDAYAASSQNTIDVPKTDEGVDNGG